MRRILTGITFLLIVFLVISAVIGAQLGSAANDGNGIELATVKRIDVRSLVSTTGALQPESSALLSFGVSGTVSEVLVEVGDQVTEGDILARLDTAALLLQRASAEQSVAAAQANFDRLTSPPTEAQLAQAQAAIANAEVQLAAAQNARMIAPEQQDASCAAVSTAQTAINDAQTAYDEYVRGGVMMDPLFEPDPDSPAVDALDRARTNLESAERQCRIAEMNATDTGQVTAAETSLNNARAALDGLMAGASDAELRASSAQLEQARIQLAQVDLNLSFAVITAPFSGVISDAPLRVGQVIGAGQTGLTLIDAGILHIDADVDEVDVIRVATGQTTDVRIDALEDQVLTGSVVRIAPTGRVTQGVTTYSVRVAMAEAIPDTIRSGMSAEVDIVVGEESGVLAVPTRAIQRDEGAEYIVIPGQSEDGQPLRVIVRSGQIVGDLTVVTPVTQGELEEGQTIQVSAGRTALSGFGFGGGRP